MIDYLEENNTELWIITEGYGPQDKMFPKPQRSSCFILRRGSYKYQKYLEIEIKKVKTPLDDL